MSSELFGVEIKKTISPQMTSSQSRIGKVRRHANGSIMKYLNQTTMQYKLDAKPSTTERLRGGADIETSAESEPPLNTDTISKPNSEHNEPDAWECVMPEGEEDYGVRSSSDIDFDSGEMDFASQKSSDDMLDQTRDTLVEEMLETVLHNIQDATKALECLGESFENDLKSIFEVILARVANCVDQIYQKIQTSEDTLQDLRRKFFLSLSQISETHRNSILRLRQRQNAKMERELKKIAEESEAAWVQKRLKDSVEKATVIDEMEIQESPRKTRSEDDRCCELLEELKTRLQERDDEICLLKKEMERLAKERAEYENAIQKALLKGVSCLNMEALKILRCSPIPSCCEPKGPPSCPPCPECCNKGVPCAETTTKTTKDSWTPATNKTPSGHFLNDESKPPACKDNTKGTHPQDLNDTVLKKPCNNKCCAGNVSKKSRETDLIMLLGQEDAENLGVPNIPTCLGKTKKTACKKVLCPKSLEKEETPEVECVAINPFRCDIAFDPSSCGVKPSVEKKPEVTICSRHLCAQDLSDTTTAQGCSILNQKVMDLLTRNSAPPKFVLTEAMKEQLRRQTW